VLADLEAGARTRAATEASLATLETELRTRAEARASAEAELETWSGAWSRSVTAIGLAPDASPEEAVDTIDELQTAATLTEERDKLARRVRGIHRDAGEFEADVRRLVALHAPDLAELAVDAAAAQLSRRFTQGKADLALLGGIEGQLEDKRQK